MSRRALIGFFLVLAGGGFDTAAMASDEKVLQAIQDAVKYSQQAYEYAHKASLEETRDIGRNFARKAMLYMQSALEALAEAETAVNGNDAPADVQEEAGTAGFSQGADN